MDAVVVALGFDAGCVRPLANDIRAHDAPAQRFSERHHIGELRRELPVLPLPHGLIPAWRLLLYWLGGR